MRRIPRLVPATLTAALALASCGGRGGTAAYDSAVDRLFAVGYPQGLVEAFCALGTNPELGFRWAGTTAERAVGEKVAAEMRAMGLANVRLEAFPVDVFEFRTARVTVGDRAMTASTIAGSPPTPDGGITAPVVYVGGGTAADFDKAGDVAGKLVLVEARPSSWWFNWPGFEAGYRGAAGVICTFTPEDPKYFAFDDTTLGSFDGQYALDAPPWVYVAKRDGDALRSALALGPVTATLLLDEEVTLARDGGVAYNVVGEIAGEDPGGQMVVLAAHQDAHFRAGVDDTGALADMLAIAKAMRRSGHRPRHTLVFLATAAEEFAWADSYYDWLGGAWWAVAKAHPDWPGKVRGMINLESMALKDTKLSVRSGPELAPWLERLGARNAGLLPHGFEIIVPVSSWNDQWPFTASGVPSLKLDTTDEAYDRLYHSNKETAALVDADHLARLAKLVFRMVGDLDRGLLPYSPKAKAADIAAAVKPEELRAAGVGEGAIARLESALSGLRDAAEGFEGRAASIPAADTDEANLSLIEAMKALNAGLTSVSPADDDATLYPHEPVLREVLGLVRAVSALRRMPPDRSAALEALAGTGTTRWGLVFSRAVYRKQLARLAPGYPKLGFGELGRLAEPLDVMPQYRAIEAGDAAGALPGLEAVLRSRRELLEARLSEMADTLERAGAVLRTAARP